MQILLQRWPQLPTILLHSKGSARLEESRIDATHIDFFSFVQHLEDVFGAKNMALIHGDRGVTICSGPTVQRMPH
eukprot:SAG31_NODE_5202_length_2678_cov_30.889492_1_plen_75_part_00